MDNLELDLVTPTSPGPYGFRLHPALDPSKYEMTGSLANVKNWRAFCYVGNDCDETEHLKMQEVGYVMISLSDDTIIPIARGDEHHRGYDLLHDFASGEYTKYQKKGGRGRKSAGLAINVRDYIPVWAYGTNYVYGAKDAATLVPALRKWLSYGGRDGIVWGAQNLRGRAMSSSEFVRKNGDTTFEPGKLAPIGAEIYQRFEKLSQTLVKLGPQPDRPAMIDAYKQVSDLLMMVEPYGYKIGTNSEWLVEAKKQLREVRKSGDSQKLWEFVFGFSGIKNTMHVHIRKEMEDESSWSLEYVTTIWGDLNLAIDMLGRL